MITKIIATLAIFILAAGSAGAQANIFEQAGIKDWMSAKGSVTELGNYYYILRRTLPVASDTSLFPATYPVVRCPIQLMLSKYDKNTFQLIGSTIITGDTIQNDDVYSAGMKICIHRGRIHMVYEKMQRKKGPGIPPWYRPSTFYMQLDTNLNIRVNEYKLFPDELAGGTVLSPMHNENMVYVMTDFAYVNGTDYDMNKYFVIDTLGSIIQSDTLGYPKELNPGHYRWFSSISPYANNRYLVYGRSLLGVTQPGTDNSIFITDAGFNIIDTLSLHNSLGRKTTVIPTGSLFTLRFGWQTKIDKASAQNHFSSPAMFSSYGIDSLDEIHAPIALSYNPYDHKVYSVCATHKNDPFTDYCYFPATPQDLQFPYGYSEIICLDTNLNLQWKKYLRIDQHAGGCGGPWYAIVPDGREGINIAGGWYNNDYDGNGTDTISEFLYYITAGTVTDSTVLPTAIDKQGIEIRDRVKIYPNPASDKVWIDDIEARLGNITLYDAQGRAVRTQSATAAKVSVDIAALPPGLYLVRVTTKDGGTMHRKIIKR
jgi:hypothetical protein